MTDRGAPDLERGRGIALWRQIAGEIAADIQNGTLRAGDSLPPERELAAHFGVNRHTIRQSMASLAEDGLIRIEQGRGTYVQDIVLDYQVGPRTRFSEIVARQNRTPRGTLVQSGDIEVPVAIARALGDGRKRRCVMLETLNEADGRPVSVGTHYFPLPRFAAMVDLFRDTGSITKALAQLGIEDYERRSTRILARLPDADEARLLRQPPNRPILVTEAVNVDGSGTPIEFGLARFASDRVQIIVEN